MNATLANTLEEWLIDPIEKSNHKLYEEALTSIRRYPFDINTPKDLLKLNGFNKQLIKKLFEYTEKPLISQDTQQDTEYKRKEEKRSENKKRRLKDEHEEEEEEDEEEDIDEYDCSLSAEIRKGVNKEKKRKRNYVPKKGSSSYALIMGLFDAKAWKEDSAVEKTELIEKAKPYSDVSLEPPDCQKPATVFRPKQFYFYSGWGSIKTLIGNGLVLLGKRKGTRKSLYYLSVDGVILAQKLSREK